MSKIVIIGAGSGFGGRLSIDILTRESLRDATIALCDIDADRLEKVTRYVQRAVDAHKLPARIVSSTNREELLPDADCVVTSVSVGGPAYWGEPYRTEKMIPKKYGVDQSVADTLGPGGIFRFLRSAPVQLEFCRDVERLCPDALVLNYTNPMAMLTWVHSEGSSVQNVGLCHSVQGTSKKIAMFLDLPYEEMVFLVAGINHQAWFLRITHKGEDCYPKLREAMNNPEIFKRDPVRFEMMRHFGRFVTESSGHNSEYLPYFRRTKELRDQYGLYTTKGVSMSPRNIRAWMQDTGVEENQAAEVPELTQSHEYASAIVEARLTNQPFAFNGNVMNRGLIPNLPEGCCVEVPCLVDGRGIQPCHVGSLPPQLAGLNRTNIAVQELAVRAVLDRDREAAFHALALDPLTASVLSLPKIREMFEEMWEAERHLLGWFD